MPLECKHCSKGRAHKLCCAFCHFFTLFLYKGRKRLKKLRCITSHTMKQQREVVFMDVMLVRYLIFKGQSFHTFNEVLKCGKT